MTVMLMLTVASMWFLDGDSWIKLASFAIIVSLLVSLL